LQVDPVTCNCLYDNYLYFNYEIIFISQRLQQNEAQNDIFTKLDPNSAKKENEVAETHFVRAVAGSGRNEDKTGVTRIHNAICNEEIPGDTAHPLVKDTRNPTCKDGAGLRTTWATKPMATAEMETAICTGPEWTERPTP
jgi:hypothetical protein